MNVAIKHVVPEHVPAELVHEFDIYDDPGIRRDLHREYSRILNEAPGIFYTPDNGGHWMVTRFDTISAVVMDTTHFSTEHSQIPKVANPPRFIPLNYDPPENMPYRKLLMPFFSPKAVRALDAEIEFQANRIVDLVKAKGRCNFVADVAAPFPVTVFMILMGLPLERFDDFRQMVDDFFNAQGTEKLEGIAAAMNAELLAIINARRAEPKEDLVSFLVDAEMEGRKLTEPELLNICFLLVLGGLDTVTNMLTFTTHRLALEPEIQKRLIADPSLINAASEEGLRLFGVVNVPRVVKKDVDLLGVPFRVGDMVLCTLPLAGWDDKKNDNPAAFDLDRKERHLLTFSTGAHLCLGHFLARSELRTMYRVWMEKIGEFRLADNAQFHYRAGTVMALDRLDLEWDVKG
jgi:cytochrome P450